MGQGIVQDRSPTTDKGISSQPLDSTRESLEIGVIRDEKEERGSLIQSVSDNKNKLRYKR